MHQSTSVGFIGLGAMGSGMARNLVLAGYDVLAYDIASEPLQRLVSQGGRKADSILQIGAECQQVMLMVVNGAQVADVIGGDQGLLQSMSGGTIMVCSTISLSDIRHVADTAATRGVTVIDCPVSGGVEGAAEGTLTLLCGGETATVEAQRPLLEVVGANVVHLGPLGAGLIGKTANNLIIGVGRIAVAEAMSMAKKAGVSLEALYRTLTTCTADSRMLRSLEGPILRGDYPAMTFHAIKDLTAAIDSGRVVQQAMPLTNLSREIYQLADTKLGGLRGSTEVLRFFLDDSETSC